MRFNYLKILCVSLFMLNNFSIWAQEDTISTEEDFSIYDDFGYAGEESKTYANVKINGLSPQRLISVGYDYQGGYDMTAGAFAIYEEQTARVNNTQGIRLSANIPVYSKNNLIVQVGAQYWGVNYAFEELETPTNPLLNALSTNNMRTMGLNSTIYKPLNAESFILMQMSADMNGDYALSELQPMKYNRYSIAALWGKRPSDYKQWAIGVSRTYRAGELNYVPIFMYNYTSPVNNWGVELLLPARGHVRYTVNSRNMLFAGFELEGNSYRIGNQGLALTEPNMDEMEVRRGEIRFRGMYQRQLSGFIWLAAEAGYRVNYSFNVDEVENGKDFYRGFFGEQPLLMENSLTNPLYFNLSINLVSP